jgi:hypothetical protein
MAKFPNQPFMGAAANVSKEPTLTDAALFTNGCSRYVSGNNLPVMYV